MKIRWTLLTIGLILFLVFIPRPILYPDYKIIGWLVYGLIFGLLPYSVYKLVDSFDIKSNKEHKRLALACLTPLLIGPSFGYYHQYTATKELQKHGQWTKGIVIDKKWIKNKSQSGYWGLKCAYLVDKEKFETSYETIKKDIYDKGDSLRIIYSTDYPKIYELEFNWEKE